VHVNNYYALRDLYTQSIGDVVIYTDYNNVSHEVKFLAGMSAATYDPSGNFATFSLRCQEI
jgi:hypothetical protein